MKFNDKTHPEKQQIDLSFIAEGTSLFDSEVPIVILGSPGGHGSVIYRISHTARTWGADIDALLHAHVRSVVDEIPKFRKWLANHELQMGILAFGLLFLGSIVGAFSASTSFVTRQRAELAALNEISSTTVTPAQMSYLLDVVAAGSWERFLFMSVAFLFLSFVVSIGVGIWVGSTANNLPPSFLLLTKESEKHRRKVLNSNRRKLMSFCASVVVGLIVGIAGNVLYTLWFARLIDA